MRFDGIIFDFDGVLIESEIASNRQIAEFLTDAGHPTTTEQAMDRFMGLAQRRFIEAVEAWVGGPIPAGFDEARVEAEAQMRADGLESVAGAIDFVLSLPPDLPRAVASSSSRRWIAAHLDHLGLTEAFGDHLYSGKEDVENGKPAPDLHRLAATRIGVPIERVAIIEDSPVGMRAAAASGAFAIGLTAGSHCAPGHGERLLALGADAIACDFDEIGRILGLSQAA